MVGRRHERRRLARRLRNRRRRREDRLAALGRRRRCRSGLALLAARRDARSRSRAAAEPAPSRRPGALSVRPVGRYRRAATVAACAGASGAASSRRGSRPAAGSRPRPQPRRAGSSTAAPRPPGGRAAAGRRSGGTPPTRPQADEAELDEQQLPVADVPEVVQRREPLERHVDAGRDDERDQRAGDLGEPPEGRPRSSRSSQTTSPSESSPPIHSVAADRCTQSANDGSQPRSSPWWLASDRPAPRPSESRNAGQSSTRRPVSHARKRNAATRAKPSSMTTNAFPKRVVPTNGERSP